MRVYLDTCALQRPLDTKSQIRIALEAEAVLGILALCEAGAVELISSDALIFEMEQNPKLARREYGFAVLSEAKRFIGLNERVETRARELNTAGVRPLDALHLAPAEEAQADYFCTCDDGLLKRAKTLPTVKVKLVSPLELVAEIEK